MAFGGFASAGDILLPDVEFIIGQDIAKFVDYTTTVVHRIVPELIRGSYDNRVYYYEDVVFRDKAQLKYSDLTEYTSELIDSLDLSGQCALLVDSTGVGAAVFDLYESAGLDPLGIVFTGGESVNTKNGRSLDSVATSRFGSISCFDVPKVDLVGSLQVYVQQGRLRMAEGLRYEHDAQEQYRNFVGRINEKTKYVKYGNSSDEIHDDVVVADAMCTWYTQHMKKMLRSRPLAEFSARKDHYRTNPFEEEENEWQ